MIEYSLISAIVKQGDIFSTVRDILTPEDFSWSPFKKLWKTFQELDNNGIFIDSVTLNAEFEKSNLGEKIVVEGGLRGREAIEYLKNYETEVDKFESYALQIKEISATRKLETLLNEAKDKLKEGKTPNEIIALLEVESSRIATISMGSSSSISTAEDAVEEAYRITMQAINGDIKYVPSGFSDFDKRFAGFFKGRVYLIVGISGEGKSALAASIANNVAIGAKFPKKVGIFPLEMSKREYVNRLISQISGIDTKRLDTGIREDEYETYGNALKKIKSCGMLFDDSPYTTIPTLRAKIRKMVDLGVELIIIDQLEQIEVPGNQQEYIKLNYATYMIKAMAREFDVPILLIHQLKVRSENQKSKDSDPVMSDISQAGEKAVNMVIAIKHKKDDEGEIINSYIYILKNRDGRTGDVINLKFEGERVLFRNIDSTRGESPSWIN